MDAFSFPVLHAGGLLRCGQCLDTSLCPPVLCPRLLSSGYPARDIGLEVSCYGHPAPGRKPWILGSTQPSSHVSLWASDFSPLGIYFPSEKRAGKRHRSLPRVSQGRGLMVTGQSQQSQQGLGQAQRSAERLCGGLALPIPTPPHPPLTPPHTHGIVQRKASLKTPDRRNP